MDGMGWDGKDRMGWSSNIGCSLRAFSVLIRFFFVKSLSLLGFHRIAMHIWNGRNKGALPKLKS